MSCSLVMLGGSGLVLLKPDLTALFPRRLPCAAESASQAPRNMLVPIVTKNSEKQVNFR